ncbi:osmotically inducible protein OsmC [Microtetraspora sp. NBRC 13810]|uniref:OsmC family peroxiredoxin n=1 Tax=Microtetraspora sp. NBRC 13810 TaxID=3030990 RepID=UPI0024A03057|nr:OsmC family peroxiredoxin [Microtetraspora sp. NBRC 13810]GLW10732.1 osmotically inducible protein OsmC [Microtetraspora sp. NBRC 13810]
MPDRIATTRWTGDLINGSGTVTLVSSGAGGFTVSLPTRAGEPDGQTSPEELVAAAHAACYSMQLSALLTASGTPPDRIDTTATVSQNLRGEAYLITEIRLVVRAVVPGADPAGFRRSAERAKEVCPVSVALSATPITLDAELDQVPA